MDTNAILYHKLATAVATPIALQVRRVILFQVNAVVVVVVAVVVVVEQAQATMTG